MSKKSRRRNRKILGALALLGTGLALANRGKGSEMSNISVDSGRGGDSASAKARASANKIMEDEFKEKVYKDAIMRGDAGVKAAKQPLRFGQVVDKEGKTKTLKPFESAGLTLGVRKTDKTPTQRAVDLANKQMAKGMLPPQLRAPGRTNITTQQGKNREAIRNFFKPSEDSKDFGLGAYDMKDGGRVTKRRGAAKRGFGKAFKGGK
tara:strand:- start:158 stop:778 length:621 start_codon:yes stop_codon:yes gene_type:complete